MYVDFDGTQSATWNKIVEWDAALVEYLARDPPPAQKQQKKDT